MITVVDYGRGNLFSLGHALKAIGRDFIVTGDAKEIRNAKSLILPGVGAFGDALKRLRDMEIDQEIKSAVERGVPLAGICLGMQLLADRSEEFGVHEGLGFVGGTVKHLSDGPMHIPNTGWRPIVVKNGEHEMKGISSDSMFYFVHSYGFFSANDEDVVASLTVNGDEFAAIVRSNNVVGCQFHPEKSGEIGLRFLDNMLSPIST